MPWGGVLLIMTIFFVAAGILYVVLGIYCTLLPGQVAANFGFDLTSDAARSEFFTVYGGMEFGLGLAFVTAAFLPAARPGLAIAGLGFHAGLLIWRTISFLLWAPAGALVPTLFACEFLLTAGFLWAAIRSLKGQQARPLGQPDPA